MSKKICFYFSKKKKTQKKSILKKIHKILNNIYKNYKKEPTPQSVLDKYKMKQKIANILKKISINYEKTPNNNSLAVSNPNKSDLSSSKNTDDYISDDYISDDYISDDYISDDYISDDYISDDSTIRGSKLSALEVSLESCPDYYSDDDSGIEELKNYKINSTLSNKIEKNLNTTTIYTSKNEELDKDLDEDGLTSFERELGVGDLHTFFALSVDIFEPILEHPLVSHIKTNFYLIDHTSIKTIDDAIYLIKILNDKYAEMPIYAIRVYEFPADDLSLSFTSLEGCAAKILRDRYWKEVLLTITYNPNRSKYTDVYSIAYKDKRYSYDTDNMNDVSFSPQFEAMLMDILPHKKNSNCWKDHWSYIYIVHFYTPDIWSKAPLEFEGPFDPY